MITKLSRLAPLVLLPLALALTPASAAEKEKKASSPFQGFSSDNGKPVDVKSDSLEVHQDEQKAIFTGNVVATQGESVLRTNELTVFYDNAAMNGSAANPADAAKGADASKTSDATKPLEATKASDTADSAKASGKEPSKPGSGNSSTTPSGIKKLIAKGNVVVTSKDQKATGDDGVFDMATNMATLTGREVVMVQGANVVKGKKLVVNIKTGVSNVTGGTSGLFVNSSQQKSN
jgi:lipopolysaccharide export system protein LptA